MPVREAMALVRPEARQALDLDPSLPEAHAVLGTVAAYYDYDWTEAERQFGQAMAHDPVPAQVRVDYGAYLQLVGRPRDAVEQYQQALTEDPLNAVWRYRLGYVFMAADRDMDAEVEYRKALELDEHCAPAIVFLCLTHMKRGAIAEALVLAERAYALAPVAVPTGVLAAVLTLTGDVSRADALRQQLEQQQAYAALAGSYFPGTDPAADWMEKAIEQRDPVAVMALFGAGIEIWRSSPRWPALATMLNLPVKPSN
jgi:Tfp pilus assembly protein PilF